MSSDEEITISWIRHGESMAQMMENAIDDQYLTPKDKQDFQEYRSDVKTEEIKQYRSDDFSEKIKEAYKAYEIETYKGGKKIIQNRIDINTQLDFDDEESNKKFINDKVTEYAKLTPASWFLTPTLTYAGKIQAETLGVNFFNNNKENYNENDTLFICSPTVRTIMTALYALHNSQIIPKPIIHIVPYTNEMGMDTYYLDRANAGIPYEIIDEVVSIIRRSINTYIKVDTTNYIETAKKAIEKKENIYLGDFEKSKTHISKLLDGKKKVAAFVHANFIINRIGEAEYKLPRNEFPINCNVYNLKYDATTIDPKPIVSINPEYEGGVRNKRLLTVKEEEQNIDFSSLKEHQLRGDINKKWIECYDINSGNYTCTKVEYLAKHFSKTGGKRKTRRRNKKYTSKKRRTTRKKTKRNLRRR